MFLRVVALLSWWVAFVTLCAHQLIARRKSLLPLWTPRFIKHGAGVLLKGEICLDVGVPYPFLRPFFSFLVSLVDEVVPGCIFPSLFERFLFPLGLPLVLR